MVIKVSSLFYKGKHSPKRSANAHLETKQYWKSVNLVVSAIDKGRVYLLSSRAIFLANFMTD